MKQLANLLVLLALMCGSVQGQAVEHKGIGWSDQGQIVNAIGLGLDIGIDSTIIAVPAIVFWIEPDRPDSLESVSIGFQGNDQRKNDTEYWYFEGDGFMCAVGGCGCESGTLYRRLDRWYLDTVQVCDTAWAPTQKSTSYRDKSSVIWEEVQKFTVHCRDTSIYAKRVKKTETKWVRPRKRDTISLPFPAKHFKAWDSRI